MNSRAVRVFVLSALVLIFGRAPTDASATAGAVAAVPAAAEPHAEPSTASEEPHQAEPSAAAAEASVVSAAAAAGAPRLSWWSLRSTLKRAGVALESGRRAEALRLYEEVLAGTPRGEGKRAEALYWAGMLRLSSGGGPGNLHASDAGPRDLERARAALKELRTLHPRWSRGIEARLALALAEEAEAARSSLEVHLAEAARDTAACGTAKEELVRRAEASEEAARALKAEVETLHTEAAALREDMKKKDEALRKVKEVLVGWKPSR